MNVERVCGNCIYGADAHDRYGNLDPNYVICQIKEAENRQRKPNRFNTTSAVSRMHYNRESCMYWKADTDKVPGEQALPVQPAQAPESLYDQMYGSSEPVSIPSVGYQGYGGHLDQDLDSDTAYHPGYQGHDWQPPAAATYKDTHVATAENEAEIKRLKQQLMQKEQMLVSLQNQNVIMSEELTRLKENFAQVNQKLEKLKPFDPALFAEVNYFSLLGVKENATPEQIKEAYRTRMKLLHPDRFINISQRLNQAYEVLMDAEKRRKYLIQIKGMP